MASADVSPVLEGGGGLKRGDPAGTATAMGVVSPVLEGGGGLKPNRVQVSTDRVKFPPCSKAGAD